MLSVKQGSCEYQFCSHWFDPTRNQTRVCSSRDRRSIPLGHLSCLIMNLKIFSNVMMNLMLYFSNESEDITKASHEVRYILARNMKPYSDDEIMKQVIVTFATECCSSAIQQKAEKLQLSNNTVTRRFECISNDQHDQLLEKSKNFVYYSVALDSSKDFTQQRS